MNIRWLWRDYIPPGLSLGELERSRVHRRANELRPKDRSHPANRHARRIYGRIYVPIAIAYAAFLFYVTYQQKRGGGGLELARFGIMAVWMMGIWFASAIARGKTHAPYVCRALREMGHDICAECGYSLKGLSATEHARCPECGWVRDDAAGSP